MMNWRQFLPNPTTAIEVLGRRWRDSFGNTYHTADVSLNGKQWKKSPITYGYGDHYTQTAMKMLADAGILTPKRNESFWRACERSGIRCAYEAVDVKRKKDL